MSTIIVFIVIAFFLFWFIRLSADKHFILRQFTSCNCIVCGKKGTGKDLIFSWVIRKRNKKHYSNIIYDKNTEIRTPNQFELGKNCYVDLINGTFQPVPKINEEKVDYYISDGGIVLPSQYQGMLCKLYPSLPIYYALSRHLACANIHINSQTICRIWDKLREQADGYFVCRWTKHIGRLFLTKLHYYDRYDSAKNDVRPYTHGLLSGAPKKAMAEDFHAKHGLVKTLYVLQYLPKNCYDTRAYHKVVYGVSAPIKCRVRGAVKSQGKQKKP